MSEKTVLAIDPGTSKCGLALVRRTAQGNVVLIWHDVAATELVRSKLHEAYAASPFELVIIGDGTNSQNVVRDIREHLPSMATLIIDETGTSVQARERYWEYHPRTGWRRFLPATLQVPPGPVDAFAAMVLAERVLNG